jgi:hypothetical protein
MWRGSIKLPLRRNVCNNAMWNQLVTSHSNKSYAVTTAKLNHAEFLTSNHR